ncbi:MAG: NAD(P)/FAD-dependent oxidoreductase [Planctomycetota bacterium]
MIASTKPRVVVVGAGFAGLFAVKALAGAECEIVVVDRRNHHLFQPLLYQVATAALNPSDIAYPIRSILRSQRNVAQVLLAGARAVRLAERVIEVDAADPAAPAERVPYDFLVLATGATHSYFGHDDWATHAPGLKTLEDALSIRRRVLSAYELAERDPSRRKELLTFVVIGAGPTGVELAGALAEIACHTLVNDFDSIDPSSARVVLVEGGGRVLPQYGERSSEAAQKQLRSLGVEVRTSALVTRVDAHGVTFADGESLRAATVLWAAGVRASPLAQSLGVPLDRAGRVIVDEALAVPGHPEVFVVGDLAAAKSGDRAVPGVAPAAIQGGRHVAAAIRASLRGRQRPTFRYRDKGSLATIGRARAVAEIGRFRFRGFVAWFAWMAIHIAFLIGFRSRLFVMLSWMGSYLTFRRGARLITGAPLGEDTGWISGGDVRSPGPSS